ncbi:MAG TPA: VCBS repeat-containing protein [Bryobacteraceae bacterium]|nr:VCBS repeat-containing protein [Bryobacteraceae bacterium]
MKTFLRVLLPAAAAAAIWAAVRPPDIPFEKHTLDLGANETCAVADINGDGKVDIVSGENWYEAPTWKKHHFRDLPYSNYYIDNFSDLPLDVNGDGRIDIVGCSWFAHRVVWFENPGRDGAPWKEHLVETRSPVEFAFLVDIDNDGKKNEVLPQFGDGSAPLTWYEARGGTLVGHTVSNRSYGHGIGAGDVNGDHRTDILTQKGWFEAPVDPRSGEWKFHADWDLGDLGFINTLDVNGDGKNDIVTSMAHGYGIFWLEQGDGGKWTKHVIDESWSQSHAMTMVDLNGDGRMDLVTGKRFWAHNGHDPGGHEPLGIYWYEYIPPAQKGGNIEWVRHVVDYGGRTGGGMQIPVADLDGDGDLDFVVAGKSGLFLFENKTR